MILSIVWAFLRAYWLQIAIVVAVSSVIGGYTLHERHVQRDKDAKVIASLRTELATIRQQLDADASALSQIAANADANRRLATAQAEQAKKELARVRANAAAHNKALQAALDHYHKAAQVSCADEALPDGVLQ